MTRTKQTDGKSEGGPVPSKLVYAAVGSGTPPAESEGGETDTVETERSGTPPVASEGGKTATVGKRKRDGT